MEFGLSLTPVSLGAENVVSLDNGVNLSLVFRRNTFSDFYVVEVYQNGELQFANKVVAGEDMLLRKYENQIIPSSDRMEDSATMVKFR